MADTVKSIAGCGASQVKVKSWRGAGISSLKAIRKEGGHQKGQRGKNTSQAQNRSGIGQVKS